MKKAINDWVITKEVQGRWGYVYVGLGTTLWVALISATALIVAHGADAPGIGALLAVLLLMDVVAVKVTPFSVSSIACAVGASTYLMVTGNPGEPAPGALLAVVAAVVMLRAGIRQTSAATLAAKNPIHMD